MLVKVNLRSMVVTNMDSYVWYILRSIHLTLAIIIVYSFMFLFLGYFFFSERIILGIPCNNN